MYTSPANHSGGPLTVGLLGSSSMTPPSPRLRVSHASATTRLDLEWASTRAVAVEQRGTLHIRTDADADDAVRRLRINCDRITQTGQGRPSLTPATAR